MKLRKSVLALALAALASGAAQATPYLGNLQTSNGTNFNDGILLNVNGFDVYSQGSAAFYQNGAQLNPAAMTALDPFALITVYYQGVVSAINTGVSSPSLIYPGHSGTYQLTVAAIFYETVAGQIAGTAILSPLTGGRISVFYDDASLSNTFITSTASILAGIGYTDGKVVIDGSIDGVNSESTTYKSNGVKGSGDANLVGPLTANAGVDDPDNVADKFGFLPTTPSEYTSTTTLQYGPAQGSTFQTNSFFDNTNDWSTVAVNSALTIRADANVDLQIPEPVSLALVGIGLVGLGFGRRRHAAA